MTYECQLLSGLLFFGERNRKLGSTLTNSQFSDCFRVATPLHIFYISCLWTVSWNIRKRRRAEPSVHSRRIVNFLRSVSVKDYSCLCRASCSSSRAFNFKIGWNKTLPQNIRMYNSTLVMASVRTRFVSRGPISSTFNPTVTVYSRIYHETKALEPASRMLPRFVSFCIRDTKQAMSK